MICNGNLLYTRIPDHLCIIFLVRRTCSLEDLFFKERARSILSDILSIYRLLFADNEGLNNKHSYYFSKSKL